MPGVRMTTCRPDPRDMHDPCASRRNDTTTAPMLRSKRPALSARLAFKDKVRPTSLSAPLSCPHWIQERLAAAARHAGWTATPPHASSALQPAARHPQHPRQAEKAERPLARRRVTAEGRPSESCGGARNTAFEQRDCNRALLPASILMRSARKDARSTTVRKRSNANQV